MHMQRVFHYLNKATEITYLQRLNFNLPSKINLFNLFTFKDYLFNLPSKIKFLEMKKQDIGIKTIANVNLRRVHSTDFSLGLHQQNDNEF